MKIVTFYSYKGGVGRTMCLANVAVMLAKWGHKVLMVDWDVEAPGLERYFVSNNFNGKGKDAAAGLDLKAVAEKPGLIDLLTEQKEGAWKESLHVIPVPDATTPLHFISAGRRDKHYFQRVRDFNVDTFYEKENGGEYVENLREAWLEAYDFVLIDSRTGVTEINGICTIQMPDLVVLLFTATDQGFDGILKIADSATKARQKLPYDRSKLLFLPVLTRVDPSAELDLTSTWISRFANKLDRFYKYWLPPQISREQFLTVTKVPHIAYYLYDEKLAVVKDGTFNPTSMGYAYEGIASLIANKLQRAEEFVEKREGFVKNSVEQPSVYISHTHKDREAAIAVTNFLKENGCEVISDFETIAVGEPIELLSNVPKKAIFT